MREELSRGEPPPRGRGREGFTLAELAVVTMVVGILAGLALPELREAMFKADAAHVLADANTISLAAYEYLGDHGAFPAGGGFGAVPAEMEPYLPEGFTFSYRPDVLYYWFSIQLPNADNYWQSRNLGILLVTYPSGSGIGNALRGHTGPSRYWSSTLFYAIYAG